ncbi:MAG: L,D-transpeptidase [Candidatus Caenarcaniphilales bacterium]|nr:L,D-transpeptidase [Candidatus Caenarcaniphilales bacterium]
MSIRLNLFFILLTAFIFSYFVPAFSIRAEEPQAELPYVEIDLIQRKLHYRTTSKVIKTYPIGVSKSKDFLTPTGVFQVLEMDDRPGWLHPYKKGVKIPPGPGNPLGTRWIGFYKNSTLNQSYGIHGTNQPNSVGKFVSHGCIRMKIPDSEELYRVVHVGTPVVVHYTRFDFQNHDGDIALVINEDPFNLEPLTIENMKKHLTAKYPNIQLSQPALEFLAKNGTPGQTRLVGTLAKESNAQPSSASTPKAVSPVK